MFKEITQEFSWGKDTIKISTGKIARQTDGAVLLSVGDTVILSTVVYNKSIKDGTDFFPLTVNYREMAFAAGKFPGGFIKREGKQSDREVLISRLIDRPIRPLFDPYFFYDTQVICTVLSHDPNHNPDVLSIIAASSALAISGLPILDIPAAVRVGLIGDKFVLNPTKTELTNSKLDLVIAGTSESIMMVESEADDISDKDMLEALNVGLMEIANVVSSIKQFAQKVGVKQIDFEKPDVVKASLLIKEKYKNQIEECFAITEKSARRNALSDIKNSIIENLEFDTLALNLGFENLKESIMKNKILQNLERLDGRKPLEIREIRVENNLLPRAHGSALFTRGETQVLSTVTLGTTDDEQISDSLDGTERENFLLHYNFLPYSVGEVSSLRAPGRREIGHGKLAWRALNKVMPSKSIFPYTVRVVSEVTESNGSSSMATVCSASLALMSAGVPIKKAVAGIAMGLVKDENKYVVLSDIMGDEDALGDMDFKVAGTDLGITALQMDIKVSGITFEIMKSAIADARLGINHILSTMGALISKHTENISLYAPQIKKIKIDKNKIRDVIGSGGKVIKEICEVSKSKIEIDDDGNVTVSGVGEERISKAIEMILGIVEEPEVGKVYNGKVVKIIESGAFVKFLGSKDGFMHISEISHQRVQSVSDVIKEGDEVSVKVIGIDKGRIRLTMKKALEVKEVKEVPKSEFQSEKKYFN